ncbi:HTH_38 domain-containing protein [Trichonephila clavipes]|nr:HTH_38 domain-containing protein [Trichonephila clavipes]
MYNPSSLSCSSRWCLDGGPVAGRVSPEATTGCCIWFFKKRSVISRRKQRPAFDQVSEFDRGRVVAYRDCGLTFMKIGSRVGRNQTTVMRVCDRWMPEGTTDHRGRSHSPQCTTSCVDRENIVHKVVTDRSVAS